MQRYEAAFAECEKAGFIKYDTRHQIVYLPHYLEHNPPANPSVCVIEPVRYTTQKWIATSENEKEVRAVEDHQFRVA